MDKRGKPKNFVSRLAVFLMGWGFYIVLFLCVAVVGVSVWSIASAGSRAKEAEAPEVVVTSPGSSFRPEDFRSPSPDVETLAEPTTEPAAEPPVTAPPAPERVPEPEPVEAVAPAVEPEPLYFVWPLNGGVQTPYAVETLVYSKTMDDWRSHSGLDITADKGAKVSAVARGTVESVYADPLYGTTVVIDHGDGLRSLYCNLAATPTVAAGDSVAVGDVIGAVGDTALIEVGEACHLHLEMRQDGVSVDPNQYLPGR